MRIYIQVRCNTNDSGAGVLGCNVTGIEQLVAVLASVYARFLHSSSAAPSAPDASKAPDESAVGLGREGCRGVSVHPAALDVVLLVDDHLRRHDVLHHHKHELVSIPKSSIKKSMLVDKEVVSGERETHSLHGNGVQSEKADQHGLRVGRQVLQIFVQDAQ